MLSSRAILIAVASVAIGIIACILSGGPTDVDKLLQENENLREQVDVLERMVETLNAEIDEINAVVGEQATDEANVSTP